MDKVIIAGGTGLIGSALSAELRRRGLEVKLLSRTPGEGRLLWDGVHSGDWAEELIDAKAVVNLAGSPIAVKFTAENRRELLTSRLDPTGAVGNAIQTVCLKSKPPHWINASAIGFYGDRGAEICDESSAVGTGFLPTICRHWEAACLDHPVNCPKTIVRIGVALSTEGGAFAKLSGLTRAFLGGQTGDGTQYMSWVHLDDLVHLFCWIIESGRAGIFNGTAPEPCTNQKLMSELREGEHRPWSPPVPAVMLKIMGSTIGPDASLVLDSTRAVPTAALAGGFQFNFATIEAAMKDLCTKPTKQGTL